MKIHYWAGGNFGDDLNLWLWDQLLPKPLEECFTKETLFVGIGTILNHGVPDHPGKTIVFSSGCGYGTLPNITDRWHFYCVRGPLTAQKLNLPDSLSVADGALLLREVVSPSESGQHVSFMPHCATAKKGDWKSLCESVSIRYIDPAGTVEETLDAIRTSSVVIAEAMHGAIVADALRVPWIPVRTTRHILNFKWQDWCRSLGMEASFELVPPIHDSGIKRMVTPLTAPWARQRLRWLAKHGKRQLSDENVFDRVYARLRETFQEMAADATREPVAPRESESVL